MSKAWLLNGKLVVDAQGRPILCDVCPCDGAIPTGCCEASRVYQFEFPDCAEGGSLPGLSNEICDQMGGTYQVDYQGTYTDGDTYHWWQSSVFTIEGYDLIWIMVLNADTCKMELVFGLAENLENQPENANNDLYWVIVYGADVFDPCDMISMTKTSARTVCEWPETVTINAA